MSTRDKLFLEYIKELERFLESIEYKKEREEYMEKIYRDFIDDTNIIYDEKGFKAGYIEALSNELSSVLFELRTILNAE